MYRAVFFTFIFLVLAPVAHAHTGNITVLPPEIIQGEPALVVIRGLDIRDIRKLTVAGKRVPLFEWKGQSIGLIGVDLLARTGAAVVSVEAQDGDTFERLLRILPREWTTAPMGIPEKMGGNTTAGENTLVYAIVNENKLLAGLHAAEKPFWTEVFRYPLDAVAVTDEFGYSRRTGPYKINHRGTDFRAAIGTPVYALNDGIVKVADNLTAYGKIVVMDHGGRVASYYLHLSRMNVRPGEVVKKGARIGLSGDTGYALEPHLHLSIKVGGISVDPMKFFALLGETASLGAR